MVQMIFGAITWLISFAFVINGASWLWAARKEKIEPDKAAAAAAYGAGLICTGIAIRLLTPFS